MNITSWIFRRLTQNEFKAINDQIQSEGGGSQTYVDLPKGKISDQNLITFFGKASQMDKGYKWDVPIYSLSLDMSPQMVTISQRRDSSNCIREQNKEKRINIWKSEYSDFPNDSYNELENPIYIFILKSEEGNFYAGWFYAKDYKDNWFITKNLCKPFFGESCGFALFETPIAIDFNNYHWPFLYLSQTPSTPQNRLSDKPLQLIHYGAPGTGKSYTIDKTTNEKNSIRTTFHPDSDYAGFVGTYKPTMEDVDIHYISDGVVKYAEGGKREKSDRIHPGTERKIVYKYVPQAFLKAYVEAWKRYSPTEDHPYYLVIEEINRGNCAQIFGDLFQLLDRNNMGSSSYAINADEDIRQFLAKDEKGFAKCSDKNPNGLTKEQRDKIANFVLKKDSGAEEEEIGESILNGSKLLLPPNLRIWATMNTSDQSLFPIDSAFKRRWNWEYMPIKYNPVDADGHPLDWKFEIDGNLYSWGVFLSKINPIILGITSSEDKQMGYFFAKPDKDGDIISEKIFLNKVLFYLWTDVLKDYDLTMKPFVCEVEDDNGNKVKKSYRFTDFFSEKAKEHLINFISGLELPYDESSVENDIKGEFSVNGIKVAYQNQVPVEAIRQYVTSHPEKSTDEIIDDWMGLGIGVSHFVENEEKHNKRQDGKKNRVKDIDCKDGKIYISTNGWGDNRPRGRQYELLNLANVLKNKDWGIEIKGVE